MDFGIGSIPVMSTMMAQGSLMEQVGAKMLTSQIDAVAEGMAELTKSMELSVNPNIGANFDISI